MHRDHELAPFVEYCMTFYGKGGIYDFGASLTDTMKATRQHIKETDDFAADTVDREAVRDILLTEFPYEWTAD